MFKWLKDLLAMPHDRRTEGYNFGKVQIAAGRTVDLENFVDGARLFGTYDDFDRGIEQALKEAPDA